MLPSGGVFLGVLLCLCCSRHIKSLNPELSYNRQHYAHISALRQSFPHLRILLSVGGERDLNVEGVADTGKYLSLLEEADSRNKFKSSVRPKQQQGALKCAWNSFKGWFSSSAIDLTAEEHKAQFATLVRELRLELQRNGKLLTLTMLPHVDAELFIQGEG
ncbi:GH21666 [Drosophila grimshawi]|uniref:GH21666 n=1 Tax=Drosophila grimshawi TaxID=7222 RepID=B4J5S7_DROGR|nr:GH21666 [Drosophila grimshawi]